MCISIKGNFGSIITCFLQSKVYYTYRARSYNMEDDGVSADSPYRDDAFTLSNHLNTSSIHQATQSTNIRS